MYLRTRMVRTPSGMPRGNTSRPSRLRVISVAGRVAHGFQPHQAERQARGQLLAGRLVVGGLSSRGSSSFDLRKASQAAITR